MFIQDVDSVDVTRWSHLDHEQVSDAIPEELTREYNMLLDAVHSRDRILQRIKTINPKLLEDVIEQEKQFILQQGVGNECSMP